MNRALCDIMQSKRFIYDQDMQDHIHCNQAQKQHDYRKQLVGQSHLQQRLLLIAKGRWAGQTNFCVHVSVNAHDMCIL